MLKRVASDVIRFYRRSWWRLCIVTLITGAITGLSVFVTSEVLKSVFDGFRHDFTEKGHITENAIWEIAVVLAFVGILILLPVVLAGMAAVAKVVDDSLAGRHPRIAASVLSGLRESPSQFVGCFFAVIVFGLLAITSPAIMAISALGLLSTPIRRVLARRRPDRPRRFFSNRELLIGLIPFGPALLWAVRWSMIVPANALSRSKGLRFKLGDAFSKSAEAARSKWWRVAAIVIAGVLAGVVAMMLLTLGGSAAGGSRGLVAGQMIADFLFLALPMVVITICFRLSEASSTFANASTNPDGTLMVGAVGDDLSTGGVFAVPVHLWRRSRIVLPHSPTAPYGIGDLGPSLRFLEDTNTEEYFGPRTPMRGLHPEWRLRHRQWRFGMAFVILATTGVALVFGGITSAGAATVPGGSFTMTVNTSADNTATATLVAEETACLNGAATCTLRAALDEAVTLSKGGVDGALTIDFSTNAQITVSTGNPLAFSGTTSSPYFGILTIDGLGHNVVINGQTKVQDMVLYSHRWTFEVEGIEFENGYAGIKHDSYGAGLYVSGGGDGSPFAASVVETDTFYHDVTTDAGGGIFAPGQIDIENSTFYNDKAFPDTTSTDFPSGGADIYNASTTLVRITNDSFIGSTGGSLSLLATSISVVNNSLFSTTNGGGFYCGKATGAFGSYYGFDNVVAHGDTSCPGHIEAGTAKPLLGSFGRYGTGRPPTQSLAATVTAGEVDVALGAGGNTVLGAPTTTFRNSGAPCPAFGENGASRPTKGCDAGAYETGTTTKITLTSSQNPSVFGQPVVFSATVTLATGPPTPATGSVQFSIDGKDAGSPVALVAGEATYDPSSSLPSGQHDVSAVYTSNNTAEFASSSTKTPLVQTIATTGSQVSISSSANPAKLGTNVQFTVQVTGTTFTGTATGTITLLDTLGGDKTTLSTKVVLSTGKATITTKTLLPGEQQLTATYSGDANNAPGLSPGLTQDVQAPSVVSITPSATTVPFGASVTFHVHVTTSVGTSTPTGEVEYQFLTGTTTPPGTLATGPPGGTTTLGATGNVTFSASTLPVGTVVVDATYFGNLVYSSNISLSQKIHVHPASTTVTLAATPSATPANPVSYGTPVTLHATVTDASTKTGSVTQPTGTVAFFEGSTDIATVPLVSGPGGSSSAATWITTAQNLPVGTDKLHATYKPSSGFSLATSTTISFNVDATTTVVELSSSASDAVFGQSVMVTAKVKPTGPSIAIPSGSVVFKDGATDLGSDTLGATGTAVMTLSNLSLGTHPLTAIYSPTASFRTSTSAIFEEKVTPDTTSVAVTFVPLNNATYGQSVKVTVEVSTALPGSGTPSGTVVIKNGPTQLATVSLVNAGGSTTLSTLGAGAYHLSVSYLGSADFSSSQITPTYSVGAALTSTKLEESPTKSHYGAPVTLSAVVTNTSTTAVPTGQVVFKVVGEPTPIGTVTLVATGSKAAKAVLVTSSLPGFTFTIEALYVGSADFDSSSTSNVFTNTPALTSVTVTFSAPPSVGTPVTITATVHVNEGGGSPVGTVVFYDQDRQLGTITLNTADGGQATLKGVLLPVGTDTVTATFSDLATETYGPSKIVTKVSVAQGNPKVTLSDSTSSVAISYGTSVTLRATIDAGSGPAPTGTVVFKAGGTVLGTSKVTGPSTDAVATITTTKIPMGTTQLSATYEGDSNFKEAMSPTLVQKVIPVATNTALSANPNPTRLGQTVTLTATVTDPQTNAVPGGSVTFTFDGSPVGSGAVNATTGKASVSIAPSKQGTFPITATYVPSSGFLASTGSGSVTVSGYSTTFQGLSFSSFPAIVDSPDRVSISIYTDLGGPRPTGSVEIIGTTTDKVSCMATLSPGPDTFQSVGSCTLTYGVAGTVTVHGIYGGDTQVKGSTSFVNLEVGKKTPKVTFSATPPTGWVAGNPITLAWSVIGPSPPTSGSITIQNVETGKTPVCTSTSLTGSCTFTFAPSTPGETGLFIFEYTGNKAYNAAYLTLSEKIQACVAIGTPDVLPSSAAGTIKILTAGNCDGGKGFIQGTVVKVQATPKSPYHFQTWFTNGSNNATTTLVANAPGPFTPVAIFAPTCFTVTIGSYTNTATTPGGRVYSTTKPDCGTSKTGDVDAWRYTTPSTQTARFTIGSTVTINAVASPPTPGSREQPSVVYSWSALSSPSSQDKVTVSVTKTVTVVASFGRPCSNGFSITATDGASASAGADDCHDPADPTGPGYALDTTVNVSTKATGSQYFTHWSGGVAATSVSNQGSTGTVYMYQNNISVSGIYQSCVSLSIANPNYSLGGATVAPSLLGTVTVTPKPNCPTLSGNWYRPGTRLYIKAKPTQYQAGKFGGFSGDPSLFAPTTPTQSFVLTSDVSLHVDFYYSLGCAPISIGVEPPGSASTSVSYRDGNNCPAGSYDQSVTQLGSPATLQVKAKSGHPLLGWTGVTGDEPETGVYGTRSIEGWPYSDLNVTLLGSSTFTAWTCEQLVPKVKFIYPLGTSVTETPPSTADFIDAAPGPTCPIGTDEYQVGTLVIAVANAPSVGYAFQGWSGAVTGSTPTSPVISLTGTTTHVTETATYKVSCFVLTSDYNTGEAVSPQPNCPGYPSSAHEYIGGTTVALDATGHSTDNFTGWTGSPTGTDGGIAWVTMAKTLAVYSDYTAKSVGQKIEDGIDKVATDIAVAGKKAVGVVAGVVSALAIGEDPVTLVASIGVLIGTGISKLLSLAGVSSSTLSGLNSILTDVSQTINMMTAYLNCAVVWSANANTSTNQTTANAEAQVAGGISKAYFAETATTAYSEQVESMEAARQAALSQPYALTGAPGAVAEQSLTDKIATAAGKAADSASLAKSAVAKYASRLGAVAAVGASVYSEVTSGPNVGWDSTASTAWTGGASAYDTCLNDAEPTYLKTLPVTSGTTSST